MRSFSSASGLQTLAGHIVNVGESNQIAIVQFPDEPLLKGWGQQVIDACNDELLLRREDFGFFDVDLAGGDEGPDEFLEQLEARDIEDFVYGYGADPIALRLLFSLDENSSWWTFIHRVSAIRARSASDGQARYVLVLTHSSPPAMLLEEAAVRHYRIWNPVRWEDARILVSERLGWGDNEATRSWMVASYAGASCNDPLIIDLLCQSRPASISQIVEFVSETANEAQPSTSVRLFTDLGEYDRHWQVPERFLESWQKGLILGATLERGVRQPVVAVPADQRRKMILSQIWQEQVAGLLPTVIELSVRAHYLLDAMLGVEWRVDFARERDVEVEESYFCEPGPTLYYIRNNDDIFVPGILFNFLKKLKSVRNSLAHMNPIEKTDVQLLWDLYLRAQQTRTRRERKI